MFIIDICCPSLCDMELCVDLIQRGWVSCFRNSLKNSAELLLQCRFKFMWAQGGKFSKNTQKIYSSGSWTSQNLSGWELRKCKSINFISFNHCFKSLEKSSYCSADGLPVLPASFSSGSAEWSSQLHLSCSSCALLHPHFPKPPHPPPDSLSHLSNLGWESSWFSWSHSSQSWKCCPLGAGREF